MKKHRTYKIEETPTEKYPDMVTIRKGKSFTKKFISEEKAIIWIDNEAAEKLINSGTKKVKYELESIGLISEDALAW